MDLNALRLAVTALHAEFAWRVDRCDGVGVEELFAEDGVYAFQDQGAITGRDQIREFYDARRAGGPRTSRHLFGNIRVTQSPAGTTIGSSVLTLFAGHGDEPLPATPLMVADYIDEFRAEADGSLRFARRELSLVFGDVPSIVKRG
ncbi:nuclear transport factor 2 family protein [Microbacterium sp. GXF7504]